LSSDDDILKVQTLFNTGSGDPHMDMEKEVSDEVAPGKDMPMVMVCLMDPKFNITYDRTEDEL